MTIFEQHGAVEVSMSGGLIFPGGDEEPAVPDTDNGPDEGGGEVTGVSIEGLTFHRCKIFNDIKDGIGRAVQWAAKDADVERLLRALMRDVVSKVRNKAIERGVALPQPPSDIGARFADCVPAMTRPQRESRRLGL